MDNTIVEAMCRNGTGRGHVDWTPHLRKFANMKIQVPRFAIMILAFYSATCVLIAWLGSHGGALPAQQFADMWAPWHDFTPPKLGMHPFYKHFQNRMLYSSRTEGVSNGPLGLIAPAFLWQIVDQSLLRSQVLALAILPNCHLLWRIPNFVCSSRVLMRNVRMQMLRQIQVKGPLSHDYLYCSNHGYVGQAQQGSGAHWCEAISRDAGDAACAAFPCMPT